MNLIDEYLQMTKICLATDYSDKSSVRKHNKSVNKMYEIAEKIGDVNTEESIKDFIALLEVSENNTNIWASTHLLERIQVDKHIEERALKIIEVVSNSDSAEALGLKMWLEEYKKR